MEEILLAYYTNAYQEKAIRIMFNEKEQLKYYQELVMCILNDNDTFIDLKEHFKYDFVGEICITSNKNSFICVKKKKNITFITINQTVADLTTHKHFVDTLIESDMPSHQYIYFDDYVLELSYKE